MRRLALALYLSLAGAAMAQDVDMPPPAGTIAILCAYNSVAPSSVSGKIAYVQCDQAGNLILSPSGGASGPIQVQGNVPSSAADSGNPVKIGGIVNTTTLQSFSDGQRANLQMTGNGALYSRILLSSGTTPQMMSGTTTNNDGVGTSGANTVTQVAGFNYGFNGTSFDRIRGSATAGLQVSPNAYPFGATPITASATGTTGALTLTLAGVASKTTYICGYSLWTSATAATFGNLTITGTISGTMNFAQPVAAIPAVLETTKSFTPCIPASAANTAIAVNGVAPGVGGVGYASAWGYQQ